MNIRLAQIIIWKNKAFVPSKARYANGIHTSIEPVYIVQPNINELVPAIEKILSKDPVLLPDPSREEIKLQQKLLPSITGARSWKRLGLHGISYVIDFTDKGFSLEMSRIDQKGRWEFDPSKRNLYPPGTDAKMIIQDVLDDLDSRSHKNLI